jgi:sterol desaturase/sphingolipid hydroxylase (fatty acid hydroxylase superfamily)
MMNGLLAWEPWIRVVAFVGAALPLAAWEAWAPRRSPSVDRAWRWPNNLAMVVVGALLLRAVFPLAAVGAAAMAQEAGWGLLNAWRFGTIPVFVLSLLVLDFAIWAQHRLFHRVPLLWRLHRMHHTDVDIDVTTGLRFHPLELALSMLIKVGIVLLLGAPPLAVLAFEVLLNASSLFNHANIALSPRADAWLRCVVVTPDMHRVHHSWDPRETDTNFGFNLPWWDRLFGTYQAQPRLGHLGMTIGLHEFRDPRELRLDRMLLQPFVATQR